MITRKMMAYLNLMFFAMFFFYKIYTRKFSGEKEEHFCEFVYRANKKKIYSKDKSRSQLYEDSLMIIIIIIICAWFMHTRHTARRGTTNYHIIRRGRG